MNKIILSLFILIFSTHALAVCSTQITRTNSGFGTTLTSSKFNTDLNTVYTRVNELPGDCITAESITTTQIDDGTIVAADIANGTITAAKLSGSNYILATLDSDAFATTSASYVDVTNQSVSITTNGRPVIVTLVNGTVTTGHPTASATSYLKLVRGSTDLSEIIFSSFAGTGDQSQATTPSGSFVWYDAPTAGTYTYKIQARSNNTSITTAVSYVKLFVREL